MSLRDKAAQMVWPNTYGDYVPTDAPAWQRLRRLRDGGPRRRHHRVGGVAARDRGQAQRVASDERSAVARGGRTRGRSRNSALRGGYFLPTPLTSAVRRPSRPRWRSAPSPDTALAYQQGRVTAEEGRRWGIHVEFAPVLDVNNNPANPVIDTRSFGEDPASAAPRCGLSTRCTGSRHAGHGQAFSRAWRHRCQLASPRCR